MSTLYCHRPGCTRQCTGRRDERGRPLCDRCAPEERVGSKKARRRPYDPLPDLDALINYNWEDEEEDFNSPEREMDNPDTHIFNVLTRLRRWHTAQMKKGPQS